MKKKKEKTPEKPVATAPAGQAGRPVEEKHREFTARELLLVRTLYDLGKTDLDVSKVLGIARTTYLGMLKRQGITDTIKGDKESADLKVVASLYNRATGYDYTSTVLAKNEDGSQTPVSITQHQPADTTACIFWLCNRDRENWQSLSRVINERPKGDIETEVQAWADKILQLQQSGVLGAGSGAPAGKAPGDKAAGRK